MTKLALIANTRDVIARHLTPRRRPKLVPTQQDHHDHRRAQHQQQRRHPIASALRRAKDHHFALVATPNAATRRHHSKPRGLLAGRLAAARRPSAPPPHNPRTPARPARAGRHADPPSHGAGRSASRRSRADAPTSSAEHRNAAHRTCLSRRIRAPPARRVLRPRRPGGPAPRAIPVRLGPSSPDSATP